MNIMNLIVYAGIAVLVIVGAVWLVSKVKGDTPDREASFSPAEPVRTEADRDLPAMALMERGLAQTADLVEAGLRAGDRLFFDPMRFLSRDGNYSVRAESEDGDLYIIETRKKPRFQDMYQQIYEDLRKEQEEQKGQSPEKRVRVIVCTNDPSDLVISAARENPDIEIYNILPEFERYKER